MIKKETVFEKEFILQELLGRVKEAWKAAEVSKPDFIALVDDRQRKENEIRISGHKERLQKQMNSFPYPVQLPGQRKRWKKNTEQMLHEVLWTEPLLNLSLSMSGETLEAFQTQAKAFLRRIRQFDQTLGMKEMGQALRNYIVHTTFLELSGLPQRCSSAIFGYSMLYPYTDNYIDDPERTMEEKQHFNQMIADVLQNRPCQMLSRHEEKTAALLADIKKDYGQENAIDNGLLLMLDAQQISQGQADGTVPMTEEEILDISIYKGGISVLIDRYLINHPFEEQDLYFYFAFGFLLQLCDDIQDIAQDGKEGNRTIFSVCSKAKETEEKINRLFHYTREVFQSYQSKNKGFQNFLLQNTYRLILFSAVSSRESLSEEWLGWAEERLPVSAAYLDSMQTSFLIPKPQAEKEEDDSRNPGMMRMMDVLLE